MSMCFLITLEIKNHFIFNLQCDVYLINNFVDPKRIWFIGTSIIKSALCYARKSSYRANIKLGRQNKTTFLQSKGGIRLEERAPKITKFLIVEESPHF